MPRETHTPTDSPFAHDVDEVTRTPGMIYGYYFENMPDSGDHILVRKLIRENSRDYVISRLTNNEPFSMAIVAVLGFDSELKMTDVEKRLVLYAASARAAAAMKTELAMSELSIDEKLDKELDNVITEEIKDLEVFQRKLLKRK